MKKVFLSVAIVAGMLITTNVQKAHAIQEQPTIAMVMDDDGFVEVQLQDLGEAVRTAIGAFAREYDINGLGYNAEKQLTKVNLTKKEDQSEKTIYLDAEGKEVEAPAKGACPEKTGEETPSAGLAEVQQDNGFVIIKFEELNEKVQDAVRAFAEDFDITSLKHNAEQGITEVKGSAKTDQSEKVMYFDGEGKEVEPPAPQEQQQEATEIPVSL